MTVVHLLLILLLGNGEVLSSTREYPSIDACKSAETIAHEASKRASDVIDVGTICVQSSFNPDLKPRA